MSKANKGEKVTLAKDSPPLEGERFFQHIFEGIDDGMVVLDAEMNVVRVNRRMQEMFGIDDVAASRPCHEVFMQKDSPCSWCPIQEVVHHGRVKTAHIPFTDSSGSKKMFLASFYPMKNAEGIVTHIIESVRDITDDLARETLIKTQAQALYADKSHLQATLMSIGDAVVMTDTEGSITDMNTVAERLTGHRREDVLGKAFKTVFNTYRDKPGEKSRDPIKRALAQGETIYLDEDTILIDKNGNEHHIEDSTAPIRTTDGKMIGAIIVFRDITERKTEERRAQREYEFQKLVTEISGHFMALSLGDIDEGIDHFLAETGRFFAVDRSYLFRFSTDGKTMTNTHEWCAEDIEPQMGSLQDFPTDAMPWWYARIKNGEPLLIEDVASLPDEAQAERLEFQRQSIKTLLCLPMIKDQKLFGFFGFDSIRDHKRWQEEATVLLKVLADILGNTIARHEAFRKIEEISMHDDLTGIKNRRYFNEQLSWRDNERHYPLGLLMVDLNGLKIINDAYGHLVGDTVLKQVAETLEGVIGERGIVARIGGDEFVALVSRTNEDELSALRKKMQERIKQRKVRGIRLSIAIGYGLKVRTDESIGDFLRDAENHMYKRKLTEGGSARSKTIQAILKTLMEKSERENAHARAVSKLSRLIGEAMAMSDDDLDDLEMAAKLHDIGKIAIPDEILNKRTPLKKSEFNLIKTHTHSGYQILRAADEYSELARNALYHHERWDGTGYPEGLKGKRIPLFSRIIAVADAFEAMTSDRVYRKALSLEDAIEELRTHAASQFDPDIVELFIDKVIGQKRAEDLIRGT